jgi:hypothetical protein
MRAVKLLVVAASFAMSALCAGGATATVITFGGLSGINGSPFTTYTESGFTVSPTLGTWFQGQLFGNPVPSIFSGPQFGSPATDAIAVTEGGGLFTFGGLDLAANNGSVNFTFTGLRDASTVFSVAGLEPGLSGPFAFVTIPGGVAADLIDTLVVTTSILGTSTNIDNIVVTAAVAEPASVGLLAAGLAFVGFFRRRLRNRI